jgi:hypothetical protein
MKLKTIMFGLLLALGIGAIASAQQTGYSQTNLVANTAGVAAHMDSQLSNPWGISFVPGQPFWIANNNGGTSTLYDAQGNKQPALAGVNAVTIPVASHNPCNPGCPTGTVANSLNGYFGGGAFIFDTEDGIIATWTGQANAVVSVDNSAAGAVYKGLATLTNNNGTFLLAANFNSGNIDVFDRNFNPTHLTGTFTDPQPAGRLRAPLGSRNQRYCLRGLRQAGCSQTRSRDRGRSRRGRHFRHQRQLHWDFHLRGHAERALGSRGHSGFIRHLFECGADRQLRRRHHQRL